MDYRNTLEDQHIPLAELLGIRFLSAEPDRVTAELGVRAEICTVPAILHGGAIMAFADTLGACATSLNLQAGAGTSTLESKTNFLAGAPVGSKVIGECTPIHRGKSTMVWQTKISLENGKLCAIVTQTQMVLEPRG
ncbi:MAG: PaaI family thioesterase [Candidatus Binataceae bacterium]